MIAFVVFETRGLAGHFRTLINQLLSFLYGAVCFEFNTFYHGHGLFLLFFWVFRSVKDFFTSAYYAGNHAVKQEASL